MIFFVCSKAASGGVHRKATMLEALFNVPLFKRDSNTGVKFAKLLRAPIWRTSGSDCFYMLLPSYVFECLCINPESKILPGFRVRHWRRSGLFIVNFEHISQLALLFLLLTLSR